MNSLLRTVIEALESAVGRCSPRYRALVLSLPSKNSPYLVTHIHPSPPSCHVYCFLGEPPFIAGEVSRRQRWQLVLGVPSEAERAPKRGGRAGQLQ